MSLGYEIVRFTPEMTERVAALQTHLWSPNISRNLAYFKWKYEQNPYAGPPQIYLAMLGEEAVGMRGVFAARWQVGDQEFDLPSTCDFVILPEHRDRGLAKRIMDVALADVAAAGCPFVLNLSGSPLTQLISLGMGWRSLWPLDLLGRCPPERQLTTRLKSAVKSLRPVADAYRWMRRRMRDAWSGPGERPFARFDDLAAAARDDDIRITSSPEPDGMARLVAQGVRHDRIRHVRDRAYFTWRFLNPLVEYRFLYLGRPELEGYLVLATPRHSTGVPVLKVADLWSLRPETEARLLDAVIGWGGFDVLYVWGATLAERTRALLVARGFREAEPTASIAAPRRALMAKALADPCDWRVGGISMLDMTHWDLRMIDSDGV